MRAAERCCGRRTPAIPARLRSVPAGFAELRTEPRPVAGSARENAGQAVTRSGLELGLLIWPGRTSATGPWPASTSSAIASRSPGSLIGFSSTAPVWPPSALNENHASALAWSVIFTHRTGARLLRCAPPPDALRAALSPGGTLARARGSASANRQMTSCPWRMAQRYAWRRPGLSIFWRTLPAARSPLGAPNPRLARFILFSTVNARSFRSWMWCHIRVKTHPCGKGRPACQAGSLSQ